MSLPLISNPATNYKTLNRGSRRKAWRESGSVCFALKLPSSVAESWGWSSPMLCVHLSFMASIYAESQGVKMSFLAHLFCLDIIF